MIEVGKIEDVDRMVELGALMHAESDYRSIPYDRYKVSALLRRLMTQDGVVFVVRQGGEIVGGIAGGVTEYWFSEEKVGYEHALFMRPDTRNGIMAIRLIKALKAWCKLQGAKELRMGITTGVHVEATARLYRSQGAKDAGLFFVMEL